MSHADHLQHVTDRHDITRVLVQYCRGIDRRDLDAVRDCYHDDAREERGIYQGGVDGFVAYLRTALMTMGITQHWLGNVAIEFDGHVARVESYVIAYHRMPRTREPGHNDHTVAARCLDRFERRDARWRIAHRRVVFDWTRIDPVARQWQLPEGTLLGATDATDPSWEFGPPRTTSSGTAES